ncbi:protein FAR-RED IMPAIRED RESPONSE 1-like [Beta vulgaris subsp. vulgaris]|uniref:protein FAR-RED IMPAIRED RESPONSE 1-like n=1 Tax=Beta vulgaris subsp. vulgaris TaxID=3555 RepID=UPI0020369822|nr:protein FAR-RED IMPAIRED RESPONSE 1-like [Beta vulgaris subsp. vulgaris]
MFVNNFKEKATSSGGGFFFDYCVDENRHLTRVFWADAISRKNYSLFGDMISFDTTFDTNKCCMVLAPFTGVDHHGKCVTFGMGLLAKEDIESFVWLFECFLKAMGNCQHTCLITDQDAAMKQAIEKVFSKPFYRLCMWHIMKKVPVKVGPDMCRTTMFLEKLDAVVWDRDLEPDEFDKGWNSVMREFGLEDDGWFTDMFNIRHMWIPSYFRNLFMGGILRSTQILESENNFFTLFTNANLLLVELWFRIESVMDAQRHAQNKLNSDSKNSMPRLITPLPLEKHVSLVYTHNMLYKFQREFQNAIFNCGVYKVQIEEAVEEFEVTDNTRKKTYHVTYIPDSHDCFCSYASKKPIFDFCEDFGGKEINKKKKVVGDLWSKFFPCVSLVENNTDHLELLLERLSAFEEEMKPGKENVEQQSKDKHIELFVGSNIVSGGILPPNKSSNKGSGTGKRKKRDQEIAIEASNKRERLCRSCGQLSTHDSRNCPEKKKNLE